MEITLNGYYTLIIATIVLLLGRWLVLRIKFLENFNIPEPVAGGLVAAAIIYILNMSADLTFTFDKSLQNAFMLMFFTSIGLSADFSRLKQGGTPLIVFLIVVSCFIVIQDLVGVSLASAFGLDPLFGLVTGSITLTGGHGTAGAWASVLEKYGVEGALSVGIATATFGLVAGGLIGGPVARFLIKKIKHKRLPKKEKLTHLEDVADQQSLYSTPHEEKATSRRENEHVFEKPDELRLITASSAIETLALFAACMAFAGFMSSFMHETWLELPTFVWALAGGVFVRNVLTHFFNFDMFDRAIEVFGNAALSLFLAMALLSLRLWELTSLAVPVLVILTVQVIVMMLYSAFITFRVMGGNYDAIVLTAGHCGFGLGATPTAIANMQAITDRYGSSHKAFLIVPMVGAFFVDLINTAILQIFMNIFH